MTLTHHGQSPRAVDMTIPRECCLMNREMTPTVLNGFHREPVVARGLVCCLISRVMIPIYAKGLTARGAVSTVHKKNRGVSDCFWIFTGKTPTPTRVKTILFGVKVTMVVA